MKIPISFCELKHTGHSCNAVPLGISMVASYALKHLGASIHADLFKLPEDFLSYLKHTTPKIACFSDYMWNHQLSYEFAKQIKKKSPETVIVFGGPNYPLDAEEQEEFLLNHPEVDFYIFRDGEKPFLHLLKALLDSQYDVREIKNCRLNLPNCHYITDGTLFQGELLPGVTDLNEIPSIYLSGLCDKFLSQDLMPIMLTARGCPFQCTFCQEGDTYFNRVRRFEMDRVKAELNYIAERTRHPDLMFADSNFGMYRGDVEICREIALLQERTGWPKYFLGLLGKNNKKRVLDAASILQNGVFGGGSVWLSAAIQSTDEEVLKNVKRSNISSDALFNIASQGEAHGSNTFSELILALPGDSKAGHFKSVRDLMDTGVSVVRVHQFILLMGSESSTKRDRERFQLLGRFRVMPHTASSYDIYGQMVVAPEIDEICVGNETMSFQDYLECRKLNLTIEAFYNNELFLELFKFLRMHELSISSLIMRIHDRVDSADSPLANLYSAFVRETKELFKSRVELEEFLNQKAVIDRYQSGELGNNEQLMYRAVATFRHLEEMHQIAFEEAAEMLVESGNYNEGIREYLGELAEFSLCRKKDMLSVEKVTRKRFHYNFIDLDAGDFGENPLDQYDAEGYNISFYHSEDQKDLITQYLRIYGDSNYGLGNILGMCSNARNFYRAVMTIPAETKEPA